MAGSGGTRGPGRGARVLRVPGCEAELSALPEREDGAGSARAEWRTGEVVSGGMDQEAVAVPTVARTTTGFHRSTSLTVVAPWRRVPWPTPVVSPGGRGIVGSA